jgi:hypothetical protein
MVQVEGTEALISHCKGIFGTSGETTHYSSESGGAGGG